MWLFVRCHVVIYTKMHICFLVRLLTKTLPLFTHRLQQKHIPKLQHRPGTATSATLLHSRVRQFKTSPPSSPEVHQVEEHSQKSSTAVVIYCLLKGSTSAGNAIFYFVQLHLLVYRGQPCSFNSPSHLFAGLIPDTQLWAVMKGILFLSSDYWLPPPKIPFVKWIVKLRIMYFI